jgi:transposase
MRNIIGCDWHPGHENIAMLDTETGEVITRHLKQDDGEPRAFYAALPPGARVGIEATGYTQGFQQMLAALGHELWIGDPAAIRASAVRKQKTNERDAAHLLELLLSDRFPRIGVPSPEERDLRQLLMHRHKLVGMRTSVRNQLHAVAMNQGLRRRKKLWTAQGRQDLEALQLPPWSGRRREELLKLLDELNTSIEPLDQAVEREAETRPEVIELMKQPGVGPGVGLAFALTVGPVGRFANSRKLVSYWGLNPSETSTGNRQRLGAISKQGNPLMRWLLVEAAQTAVRTDQEMHRFYYRLKFRRGASVAKVAVARKLAVKLYWRLRQRDETVPAEQPVRTQGSPGLSMEDATRPSTI